MKRFTPCHMAERNKEIGQRVSKEAVNSNSNPQDGKISTNPFLHSPLPLHTYTHAVSLSQNIHIIDDTTLNHINFWHSLHLFSPLKSNLSFAILVVLRVYDKELVVQQLLP